MSLLRVLRETNDDTKVVAWTTERIEFQEGMFPGMGKDIMKSIWIY